MTSRLKFYGKRIFFRYTKFLARSTSKTIKDQLQTLLLHLAQYERESLSGETSANGSHHLSLSLALSHFRPLLLSLLCISDRSVISAVHYKSIETNKSICRAQSLNSL